MKGSLLLLAVVAVMAIEAHDPDDPLPRALCEAERDAAMPGDWLPVCTNKGNYKNKQCDDNTCWCVSKRKGRLIFKKQKVPLNHMYDCKRKPRVCLKEELEILLTNPNPNQNPWVPDCDCMGFYEKKQCVPVDCRKRKRRQAPLCPVNYVGHDVVDRADLDAAASWTFVSLAEFASDGNVVAIEIFVDKDSDHNGELRVGIYRPQAETCKFKLIREVVWKCKDMILGKQELALTGADRMKFKKGDRYGFAWTGGSKGILVYDQIGDPENIRPFQFCEDSQVLNKGDVGQFASERHGKRRYSIMLKVEPSCGSTVAGDCDGTPQSLGFPIIDRPKLDRLGYWTMVSKDEFTEDGEIKSFEIYVGGKGRGLRVGIYRPTGGGTCQFTLVQQREWTGFDTGYLKVENGGGVIFNVKKGDRYGFTWLNFGVIDWGPAGEQNYCEKEARYHVGDVAYMNQQHGDRMYSIRMTLTPCEGATPTPNCEECYCVDPMTGVEEDGTRTTDELECD